MRADRLLSMMFILQSRGKMTAKDLAEKLEVSLRTVYRDVDALGIAGVPVYAEKGPHGGIALLEEFRTSLTGLTPGETRALFMLRIPDPLTQLGVAGELNSALLKLSAALPASRREDEEHTRNRFHLDAAWWSKGNEPVPFLQQVHEAVWHDQLLFIHYRTFFGTEFELVIQPLALIAKASVWYLVYMHNDHTRVIRVSDILHAVMQPEKFARPRSFELQKFWKSYCEEIASRPPLMADVKVSTELFPILPRYFGNQVRKQLSAAVKDEHGWCRLSLPFDDFFTARERILAFGNAIEVISPLPLRESVADFARHTAALYPQL